jgi:hypothetical protein
VKAFNIELPEWLIQKLYEKTRVSDEPDVNSVLALLLEDYIKRNENTYCDHDFVEEVKAFWDWENMLEQQTIKSYCSKCGIKKV